MSIQGVLGKAISAMKWRLFRIPPHADGVACQNCKGKGHVLFMDEYYDICDVCDGEGWYIKPGKTPGEGADERG